MRFDTAARPNTGNTRCLGLDNKATGHVRNMTCRYLNGNITSNPLHTSSLQAVKL